MPVPALNTSLPPEREIMSFLGECISMTGDGIHCWHFAGNGEMTAYGPVTHDKCCHCGEGRTLRPTGNGGQLVVKTHGKHEPKVTRYG